LEPAKPAIAGSVVCSASVTRGYDPRMPRTLRALKGIHGSLRVPADKSYAHRAFLLAALAEGASRVRGDIEAGDVQRSRALIEALGVSVRTDGAGGAADEASRGNGAEWQIEAAGPAALRSPLRPIDCGRSGTTIRLAAGLLVGAGVGAVLDADPQLRRRPMGRILDPLRRMGAKIQEHEARAPLQLEGAQALRGIEFENTLGSAQVKGALLLAGLGAEGRTVIHESRVSRRHTEAMLEEMGAQVQRQGGTTSIEGRGPSLAPLDVISLGHAASHSPWLVQYAEALRVHLRCSGRRCPWGRQPGDHRPARLVARLALGSMREVGDLRRREQHRRGVLARRHAGAAADAGRGVHRRVGLGLGNRDRVGVGRAPVVDEM
jgi:5-enolpyruvylshikimate-3-phosphate synthase